MIENNEASGSGAGDPSDESWSDSEGARGDGGSE